MRRKLGKITIGFIAASTCLLSISVLGMAHGTTDKIITPDMLHSTPDSTYQVNMDMQAEAKEGAYSAYFLEDDLQTVSIDVNEDNLNYLFQNALDKPSVMTNSVTIGDKTIGYAGLKTKGNYTLEHTYWDEWESDRFSFTINFGKYIKKKNYGVKQNFYGCNKISFNNFFFDKTMMKEFFAMKLMSEMGLPTPEYGLAKLYINQQYYGVYFMVEAMDSSILERYQKVSGDEVSSFLTKPAITKLQYNFALDSLQGEDGNFDLSSVLAQNSDGAYEVSGVLEEEELSGLWECDNDTLQDVADMLPTVFSWQKKLNQLSAGKDFSGQELDVNSERYVELLNSIMDVEEALRYFAVHSFLVQLDDMFVNQQNYGLYVDKDGKSMLIPWDYDLCFGCYHPGTAEETANFDLDVMYWEERGQRIRYSDYPIFNVIYQNQDLMEQYHNYMEECAKIVLLGGETSNGRSYTPGYFQSYIDVFTDKLEKAASEKLASNVSYLHWTFQPNDMLRALPNLSRIMAMRSVGVYSQVKKINTTVCGYGCDLSTLGNAMSGWNSNSGDLTIVDDVTGIFVRADYGGYDWDKISPFLTVKKLAKANKNYQAAKEAIGCENESNLTVYRMDNTATPEKKYTVNIPLEKAYSTDEIAVYSYTGEKVTKLNTAISENICTGKTGSIQFIAVLRTAGEEHLKAVEAEDDSVDTLPVQKEKKKIALNKKNMTLKKGKNFKLKLKNATKKVVWKSSNKKVAAVNKNGKVTAKKKGSAVIRAVSGGKTYRCKVKVKK